MIANDDILIGANAQMQIDVVAWAQCRSRLHIDLNEFRQYVRYATADANHHSMRQTARNFPKIRQSLKSQRKICHFR